MKRINKEIIRLRIRLLQKILATIGMSAIISSCVNNSPPQEETNAENLQTEVIQKDTVIEEVIPVDTVISKPASQSKPSQNNNHQPVPVMNKPDGPVTKYGVPVNDNNENMQVRYGVPYTSQPEMN